MRFAGSPEIGFTAAKYDHNIALRYEPVGKKGRGCNPKRATSAKPRLSDAPPTGEGIQSQYMMVQNPLL